MPRVTHLTSDAVPASPSGEGYPVELQDLFIPHEPIRRELLRVKHAFDHMDPVAHPWKAFGFRLWMAEYFVPAIHSHHHNEEHVIGPIYAKLGEHIAFGERKTHPELLELMAAIERQAEALAAAAGKLAKPGYAPTPDDKAAVTAAFASLKSMWAEFVDFMTIHLGEEERVMPAITKKHGKEVWDKVLQQIISTELAQKGKALDAFKYFSGSIQEAMGSYPPSKDVPATPAHALNLAPWASEAFAAQFLREVPWVPRTFLFPAWYRTYMRTWKALVDSLSGDVNTTGVTAAGFPAAGGCCTIA